MDPQTRNYLFGFGALLLAFAGKFAGLNGELFALNAAIAGLLFGLGLKTQAAN